MAAREILCRVIEVRWLTPSVMNVRFEPNKKFNYDPGQFLSIYVPPPHEDLKPKRRAYTFATSSEVAKKDGYELCVKFVPGGAGSAFLASLKPGDMFRATAPYGDFVYEQPKPGRSACFICTGTGVAPFRAIAQSSLFLEAPPENTLCLFGVRTAEERIFQGTFEAAGIKTVYAISQAREDVAPSSDGKDHPLVEIYRGRVTDYLRQMSPDWSWHMTDFYLCGNSEMIAEVEKILRGGHGVDASSIHKEAFSPMNAKTSGKNNPTFAA